MTIDSATKKGTYASAIKRIIPELSKEENDLPVKSSIQKKDITDAIKEQHSKLKSILKKPPSRDETTNLNHIQPDEQSKVEKTSDSVEYTIKPGGKSKMIFENHPNTINESLGNLPTQNPTSIVNDEPIEKVTAGILRLINLC